MTQQNKELQKVPETATGFDRFIELALDKAVPVETLERLLAMQKEIMAANAKAAYDDALSGFQHDCPIIHKGQPVMNKTGGIRYRYAPMDSIISQVREPLAKHGFSYDVDTRITETGWIEAIVTATHIGGHSKTKVFSVPIDKDAFMNEQQKVAAARTYALRYCFTGIFGIMTGDEDNDATSIEPDKTPEPKKQTTPHTEPSKAQPSNSAQQPPEPTTGHIITGIVSDITQALTKAKTTRYKITVDGKFFYTFKKDLAELAKKTMTPEGGPVTIVFHVGQWGNDIDTLTLATDNTPPLEEYKSELEPREPGQEG